MPFRNLQKRALDKLLVCQNPDGGIPATLPKQDSGSWTSAETLEALLLCLRGADIDLARIRHLVLFLLDTQIHAGIGQLKAITGAWPLFNGNTPCTMATGHCIAALALSKKLLPDLEPRIAAAIADGRSWLERHQKQDGSWGTFPCNAGDGEVGKVVAVYYAVHGLVALGANSQNSRAVRKSCERLIELRKPDGSWSNDPSGIGNASDTARALMTLIEAKHVEPKDGVAQDALTYILGERQKGALLWDIDTENLHVDNSPGQIVINKNTPCEVLVALSAIQPENRAFHELLWWMTATQDDDGLWTLSSPSRKVPDIRTWSTAEWALALEAATKALPSRIYMQRYVHWPSVKRLLGIFIALFVFAVLALTPVGALVLAWWTKLPESIQSFIIVSVLAALVVNLMSSWIYNHLVRRFLNRK